MIVPHKPEDGGVVIRIETLSKPQLARCPAPFPCRSPVTMGFMGGNQPWRAQRAAFWPPQHLLVPRQPEDGGVVRRLVDDRRVVQAPQVEQPH